MAKIEELTELLVTELSNFEKGLVKLDTIETKINNTEIQINLKELKLILNEYHELIAKNKDVQEHYYNRLKSLLENAKIYPKWAVITFIIALLLSFYSLFYTYTIKENSNAMEKTAYRNGIDDYGNYINQFFENNPKSKQAFKIWESEKKSN